MDSDDELQSDSESENDDDIFEVIVRRGPRGRRVRRFIHRDESIVARFPGTWTVAFNGVTITPGDTPANIGMQWTQFNYIDLLRVNHEETETEGDYNYDSDSTHIFSWSPEHTGTGNTGAVGTVEPNTDAEAQDADPFAAHANTVGLNTQYLGVDEDEIY